MVSYVDGNKSMINAQLFRSFRDAKHTDYQCAAYKCQHSGDILTYGESLKKIYSIKCFVNPNKPHYVYTDSSAGNSGWNGPIFFLTFELVLLLAMIAALIFLIVRCRVMSRQKRREASEVIEIDEKAT